MLKSGLPTTGLLAGAVFVLSACSTFEVERFSCSSKVTAVEIGSRVELISVDTAQPVEARLNGVSAECYHDDAETVFEVSVGLKVTRDLGDSFEPTLVQVPFLVAVVDAEENIIAHQSFGYKMALSKGKDSLYPVVDFEVDAPKGGRLVLSMTTESIELK